MKAACEIKGLAKLLIGLWIVAACVSAVHGRDVTLAWDPNSESDLAGYKLYYGTDSGNYSQNVDVGNQTQYTVTGLEEAQTYYFAVTAYNTSGLESDPSNEVMLEGIDNSAPSAQPDSIELAEGQTVGLLSNGTTSVLANDSDPDGDTLEAQLMTGPAHGQLTLNADGTFSYTHDGSDTPTDSFIYVAHDGALDSSEATVTIDVLTPPTISTVSDQLLLAGTSRELSFTIDDPDTASESLMVKAVSEDQTVLPDSNLAVTGSGNDRVLTIQTDSAAESSANVRLTVTDDDGFQATSAFNVTVTSRLLSVGHSDAPRDLESAVAIQLQAVGDENALDFSLGFDPQIISEPRLVSGQEAQNATLSIDSSEVSAGKIGVSLKLPAGETFNSGLREIAIFKGTVVSDAPLGESKITIGDQPLTRNILGTDGAVLPAVYRDGSVNVLEGFIGKIEGDVSPRHGGDGQLTIADWDQTGRIVSGVEQPPVDQNELDRVDVAPRTDENGVLSAGDGQLTMLDWVQAGRYVTGEDPMTLLNGDVYGSAQSGVQVSANSTAENPIIQILEGSVQNGAMTVPIVLQSSGTLAGIGFSLEFKSNFMTFNGAVLGQGLEGPALFTNETLSQDGQVGIAIAGAPGQGLPSGTIEMLRVTFDLIGDPSNGQVQLRFGDSPIQREVVDLMVSSLSATFEELKNGKGNTKLQLKNYQDGEFTLVTTGEPGAQVTIETSTDLMNWEAIDHKVVADDGSIELVKKLLEDEMRFYRVRYDTQTP